MPITGYGFVSLHLKVIKSSAYIGLLISDPHNISFGLLFYWLWLCYLCFNGKILIILPILAVLVTTSVYGLVDLPVGNVYSFWYSWYFV